MTHAVCLLHGHLLAKDVQCGREREAARSLQESESQVVIADYLVLPQALPEPWREEQKAPLYRRRMPLQTLEGLS